ncbi:hypothetical protein [Cryobacterium sp. Y57]|uniref:hypothetical protein n=1 Tax=Cryobacterium sp. Y57 TaxID=2048287 RepID=UPI000CE33FFF|nr:hypothetical protein [Cryobacterium sp. Y57]
MHGICPVFTDQTAESAAGPPSWIAVLSGRERQIVLTGIAGKDYMARVEPLATELEIATGDGGEKRLRVELPEVVEHGVAPTGRFSSRDREAGTWDDGVAG